MVASEVRSLAKRCSEAANEVRNLINTSDQQVKHGVTFVGEAEKALIRISGQVNEIDQTFGTIVALATDQAAGLSEVNAAIKQMEEATQQNASVVEEFTAASNAVSHQADALAALVAKFKTQTHGHSLKRVA